MHTHRTTVYRSCSEAKPTFFNNVLIIQIVIATLLLLSTMVSVEIVCVGCMAVLELACASSADSKSAPMRQAQHVLRFKSLNTYLAQQVIESIKSRATAAEPSGRKEDPAYPHILHLMCSTSPCCQEGRY